MEVLGSLGNFYLVLLLGFFFGGIFIITYNTSKKYAERIEGYFSKKGGPKMNKWLQAALASFVGIVILSFALGLVVTTGGQDEHSAHQNGGIGGSGAPAGYAAAGGSVPANYSQPGIYFQPVGFENEINQMRAQLMQMQYQLNQLQGIR